MMHFLFHIDSQTHTTLASTAPMHAPPGQVLVHDLEKLVGVAHMEVSARAPWPGAVTVWCGYCAVVAWCGYGAVTVRLWRGVVAPWCDYGVVTAWCGVSVFELSFILFVTQRLLHLKTLPSHHAPHMHLTQVPCTVCSVLFSRDSRLLYICCVDGSIAVHRSLDGTRLALNRTGYPFRSVPAGAGPTWWLSGPVDYWRAPGGVPK